MLSAIRARRLHVIGIWCSILASQSCSTMVEPVEDAGIAQVAAPATSLIDFGDPCWTDPSLSCYDGTSAGGILSGSEYGSLGGFGSTFTGAAGSDGSGFGNWEADGASCQQMTALLCVHTRAVFGPSSLNCPTVIVVNTIDPNTGNSELWYLTLNQLRFRYGIQTGKYSGSYSSGGRYYGNATGEAFCSLGMLFTTVSHPNPG